MNNKAVVIFSGGMDSATLLAKMVSDGYECYPISFNYGQRHKKELKYAKRFCKDLDLAHEVVSLTKLKRLLQGSALTSDIQVPEGHYEEESMKLTVVPNRNMIMLSIAIGYAVSLKADTVAIGVHAGDHAIYPDCRKSFIDMVNDIAQVSNWEPVNVIAPFVSLSKGEIAAIGKKLGVDYSMTWTCYKGLKKPCGKCGSCVERNEALEFAGIKN